MFLRQGRPAPLNASAPPSSTLLSESDRHMLELWLTVCVEETGVAG